VNHAPEAIHELTGAYVLHALDADERALFEAHLDACEHCAHEVAQLRSVTTRMSEASGEDPPAGLRERLLLAAAETPQQQASNGRGGPPPGRGATWSGRLIGVAAALLVVAVAGLGYLVVDLSERLERTEVVARQAEQTNQQLMELLAEPDAELVTAAGEGEIRGRAVVAPDRGEAVLVTSGLEPTPADRTYQVWLIDEDAAATPAGLLEVDADGRSLCELSGDLTETAAIGVTIEPAGGSPQPTTELLLAVEIQ
jgi:anti-sigma-K factor RskA